MGSEDSLVTALSGFSGFAAGLRDVMLPRMQAKYQARLDAEKEKRAMESAKDLKLYEQQIKPKARVIGVEEGQAYDYTGEPGQELTVKPLTKKKVGTHFVMNTDGKVVNQFPASEGSGDTVTKLGEDSEDKLKTKKTAMLPKATTALNNLKTGLDKQVALIDEILKDKNLGSVTGPYASRVGTFTDAQARIRAKIEQVKAQAFLSSFQALKQASPNGSAGMGGLTEVEGTKLEKAAVNLNTQQATRDFVKALGKYRSELVNTGANFDRGYQDEFGDILGGEQGVRPKASLGSGNSTRQKLPSAYSSMGAGVHTDGAGNSIMVYPDGTYEEQ